MIVIDTNVLSEPLRPNPEMAVVGWLDRQPLHSLYLTSTVISEAFYGIERLPEGKRKIAYRAGIEGLIQSYFNPQILPFEENAARLFSKHVAAAERNGKAIQVSDGQIAAVALINNFAVATRDAIPFKAAGCRIINPWTD